MPVRQPIGPGAGISNPIARMPVTPAPVTSPFSGGGLRPAPISPITSRPGVGPGRSMLPAYKDGTSYVPKTGPAVLHQGEAVLNKDDADSYRAGKGHLMSAWSDHAELGGSAKHRKEVKEIRIRKGKSGGHVIEHHHTHPEHHPSEEHVTANMDALHDHLEQAMGSPNPGEAQADAGQSGIPAGAGAPPPGAGPAAGPAIPSVPGT